MPIGTPDEEALRSASKAAGTVLCRNVMMRELKDVCKSVLSPERVSQLLFGLAPEAIRSMHPREPVHAVYEARGEEDLIRIALKETGEGASWKIMCRSLNRVFIPHTKLLIYKPFADSRDELKGMLQDLYVDLEDLKSHLGDPPVDFMISVGPKRRYGGSDTASGNSAICIWIGLPIQASKPN